MIDELITALSQEMEMSTEEIADTIWLALQIQESPSESVASDFSSVKEDIGASANKTTPLKLQPPTADSNETPKNQDSETQKAKIYPWSQQQTESLDLSLKTPNAPSLRQPLTLARALKPLMRRIPGNENPVVDEIATIERFANTRLWLPVLKPTLEPWLNLELVVDESISMQIWRQTIRDLEKLLKNYGIFRDVRVWGMIAKDGEKIEIRRGIGAAAKNQFPHSCKELIDGSSRRLVLVVSDCVSSYWRDGKVTKALEIWGNSVPTAIIQMLPKWLWKRTALGRASEVRLRALTPGVSNQNLIVREVSLWEELEEREGIKVPIFTLEEDKATSWAQMLSGKSSVSAAGVVFKLDAPVRENKLFSLDYSQLSAEERVQAFRVTASPMARKLAGLLAAAPVITLPVVRLIRETLLKGSLQVNVAEVFLGGLLKPASEIKVESNPDDVLYEFMDGVRELLIDSMPTDRVLHVVDKVSEYVAERVGLSLENFAAVLRGEKKVEDSGVVGEVGYFATVTADVLRCLGGEYEKVAEELEREKILDLQDFVETALDSLPNIEYQLGGCLPRDSTSYIKRKADDELYNALKEGQLCIVSAPRQMGKSSLEVQLMKRLTEEGFSCAVTNIAAFGMNITEEQFYNSLIYRLARNFKLNENINFDFRDFIQSCSQLHPYNCLVKFFNQILLKEITESIVIFIDEVDYILSWNFSGKFLSLLRALYEKTAHDKNFNRLNFVLLGVFLDSDLIKNTPASPLTNIARQIELEGFTYEEALPLAGGLAEKANNPQELLKFILEWTGGQPFLTQKLCLLVQRSKTRIPGGNEKAWLDNLVRTEMIVNLEDKDEPIHLGGIRAMILGSQQVIELLRLYQLILQGKENSAEYATTKTQVIQELLLTGLIVRRYGKLEVANKIYAEVFNQDWIAIQLYRCRNKIALLIGVSKYLPEFANLPSAVKDIEAMKEVLGDSEIGSFNKIKVLNNCNRQEVEEAIYELFADRNKDDVLLFYFSGHGFLSQEDNLFLATPETRKGRQQEIVSRTAVAASFLKSQINDSFSQCIVVILDCSYSGAFTKEMTPKGDVNIDIEADKGDINVDVEADKGGKGMAILMSSRSTQMSFQSEGSELSVYTKYIVEGIKTRAADNDNDGKISVAELHEYVTKKVQEESPKMTPQLECSSSIVQDFFL